MRNTSEELSSFIDGKINGPVNGSTDLQMMSVAWSEEKLDRGQSREPRRRDLNISRDGADSIRSEVALSAVRKLN